MRLKIMADLHLFSSHPFGDYDVLNLTPDVILLGDIVDLKQCKKKDLPKAKTLIEKLRKKHTYISGNHELDFFNMVYSPMSGIKLTHGDYIFWGSDKAKAAREEEPGNGIFGRTLSSILAGGRSLCDGKVSTEDMDQAVKFMKEYQTKILIVGHKHPKNVIITLREKYEFICVPQGYTELEV